MVCRLFRCVARLHFRAHGQAAGQAIRLQPQSLRRREDAAVCGNVFRPQISRQRQTQRGSFEIIAGKQMLDLLINKTNRNYD